MFALTVTQLNKRIKDILENEVILEHITVMGEISSFSVTRGIAYFNIKDDDSLLSCVMFGCSQNYNIGDKVQVTGSINYYVKGGKLTPEEYYSKLGFSTLKEYEADTKERAVKEYIYEKITADSKVKNYPEKDVDKILETVKKAVSLSLQQSYGIDIKTYLGYMNQTEEEFEESLIEDQVKPMMDSQMACYAIFDEAGLKLAEQDVDKKLNEKIAEIGNGVTKEDLIDAYGDFYFEAVVIKEKALDYLYDNVKIS